MINGMADPQTAIFNLKETERGTNMPDGNVHGFD